MSAERARRPAEGRARRADLPHLGVDLRLQPAVRALPVLVGPARPARAHHRRGQGRRRRAARPAGLLRQHRRRRADDAPRLLRDRRVLRRPRRRREVLDQRRVHRRRQGPPAGRHGLRRRPDHASTASTPPPTTPCAARAPTPWPAGRWTTWPRRRLRAVQDQRRRDPPQRRPARRLRGAGRRATAPSCGSPGCARRAAAPTSGTSCTRPTSSSAQLYHWLLAHGPHVLTGDSFFHLSALGEPLPGPQPVRRRPGRLPHRPDRRRVRLPVRASTTSSRPARCATPAASPRCGASSTLFRDAARAAVGRRLRLVRQLRRLPGRLHGRQVLHRPAARRPRPRVRQRPRRGAARGVGAGAVPRPAMDHSAGPLGQPVPSSAADRPRRVLEASE